MDTRGQRAAPGGIVYVIDDEEPVCDSMAMLLCAAGIRACTFNNGAEFLAGFAGADAACVLIDGRMPGLDGLRLLRELRHRGHAVPVVVMSGDDNLPWVSACRATDSVEFLSKPFSEAQLLASVRRALQAHRVD